MNQKKVYIIEVKAYGWDGSWDDAWEIHSVYSSEGLALKAAAELDDSYILREWSVDEKTGD
jgi:hypothetical protein